jgi:putative transposase
MEIVHELGAGVGRAGACRALGVPRASFYRWLRPSRPTSRASRSVRALSEEESREVRDLLNSPRFADRSPRQCWAELLDEGRYLCSVSTMFRILREHGEVRERRDQLRHPSYRKPELLATRPNQVWSWDITKLLGPAKWTYFYLYVILDIFSRYVVGWMVARGESATLAQRLIEETVRKYEIPPGQLTVHADRGSSMRSKLVAQLLADLGVTKTHTRPYTSTDNPYSESHFKTLKYRPGFPERFGSVEDARAFCGPFFSWYNTEHRHSGIGLLTPQAMHFGRASAVYEGRRRVLEEAYRRHPERFVRAVPLPPSIPEAAWINRPDPALASTAWLAGAEEVDAEDFLYGRPRPAVAPTELAIHPLELSERSPILLPSSP